jgi:3-oxosteroid 1-dehydrogenase
MSNWDETADFVIVGSGAGSMVAAVAAVDAGKKPIVLEKTDKVGG